MNDFLSLIFRWLHIIPAIVLVGGVVFMRFCLTENVAKASYFDTQDQARRRWSMLVMLSALLLLVSGLYNTAMKAMGFDLSMIYNILLLVKILLAFVVFYLTAVLAGRSERAKRFRQREAHWLNVVMVLMLLIVMIGGYMKISSVEFTPKKRDRSNASVTREFLMHPESANSVTQSLTTMSWSKR